MFSSIRPAILTVLILFGAACQSVEPRNEYHVKSVVELESGQYTSPEKAAQLAEQKDKVSQQPSGELEPSAKVDPGETVEPAENAETMENTEPAAEEKTQSKDDADATKANDAPADIKIEKGGPYEESYFATIRGLRVHFRWIPSEGGRARYVLIHGFAASTYSYRHIIDHLRKKGHEIIAIDLPDYGYSDRILQGNQSAYTRANLVWALLDALDRSQKKTSRTSPGNPDEANSSIAARDTKKSTWQKEGRWILIGHSMGGSVITAMAARRPAEVEYLVYLAGAVSGGPGFWTQKALDWIPGLPSAIAWYAENSLFNKERFASLLASAYGRDPDPEDIDAYLEPFRIPDTAASILASIRESRSEIELDPASISLPALLIWGTKDTWVEPERGKELHRSLDRSILEFIEDAGHCALETEPEKVEELMDRYDPILRAMRHNAETSSPETPG